MGCKTKFIRYIAPDKQAQVGATPVMGGVRRLAGYMGKVLEGWRGIRGGVRGLAGYMGRC